MLPSSEYEDPRRAKSRERVLAATIDLLREEGFAGLSVEAVAARSGVAKTTIYRQFADRDELHLAAVQSVGCQVPLAYSADLVADVTAFCAGLNQVLRDSDFGALLSTAVDGAERSESFAGMMHDFGVQRRQLLGDRLRTAVSDGTLPADVDLDVLTSQLVGPLFYRRFISRQPTGPTFIGRHVSSALAPLVADGPVRASRGSGAPPRSTR
jgi:AcrR family transcriptional regulator